MLIIFYLYVQCVPRLFVFYWNAFLIKEHEEIIDRDELRSDIANQMSNNDMNFMIARQRGTINQKGDIVYTTPFIPSTPPVVTPFVIGDDDRVLINDQSAFPYRAMCMVFAEFDFDLDRDGNNDVHGGTATMQGPDVALTAAHVIFSNGRWAKKVTVYPGAYIRDGVDLIKPYGGTTPSVMYMGGKFPDKGLAEDDWAILKLNDSLGYNTGWLGKAYSSSIKGMAVRMAGYPRDYHGKLVYSDGTITDQYDYKFRPDHDAYEGMSGGPIYTVSDGLQWGITSREITYTSWLVKYTKMENCRMTKYLFDDLNLIAGFN